MPFAFNPISSLPKIPPLSLWEIQMGTSYSCPSSYLKTLSKKFGTIFRKCSSSNALDAKLEPKMIEFERKNPSLGDSDFKSINSIIMRFPEIRQGLRNIRGVFQQYDEDSNGTIDLEELKKCLHHLQFDVSKQEVEDLFYSCDIDESEGIQFNEFIVLLCLIYILKHSSSSAISIISKLGSPKVEATFDTIIRVFVFLEKNGDGKLNKKDMAKSLNEASPWEKSPARISQTRFKEIDWNHNGQISFREFLFGFINWVGIEDEETIIEGS